MAAYYEYVGGGNWSYVKDAPDGYSNAGPPAGQVIYGAGNLYLQIAPNQLYKLPNITWPVVLQGSYGEAVHAGQWVHSNHPVICSLKNISIQVDDLDPNSALFGNHIVIHDVHTWRNSNIGFIPEITSEADKDQNASDQSCEIYNVTTVENSNLIDTRVHGNTNTKISNCNLQGANLRLATDSTLQGSCIKQSGYNGYAETAYIQIYGSVLTISQIPAGTLLVSDSAIDQLNIAIQADQDGYYILIARFNTAGLTIRGLGLFIASYDEVYEFGHNIAVHGDPQYMLMFDNAFFMMDEDIIIEYEYEFAGRFIKLTGNIDPNAPQEFHAWDRHQGTLRLTILKYSDQMDLWRYGIPTNKLLKPGIVDPNGNGEPIGKYVTTTNSYETLFNGLHTPAGDSLQNIAKQLRLPDLVKTIQGGDVC